MTDADAVRGRIAVAARSLPGIWLLRPPVRDPRFWWVQAGVLTMVGIHDVVLVDLHAHEVAGIPAPITSGLLLVPVIYAALNFGPQGAVGTALWATALIVPHWFLVSDPSPEHFWIEMGFLAMLNVVAVVVGQRVEREQRARQRVEVALRAARDAEARYYALFEDQPVPVIITDAGGAVIELNTAAKALFTPDAGRSLGELLGVEVAELCGNRPPSLRLKDPHGQELLLVPTAHSLSTADGAELVQVVLADVTDQHRREEEERLFAGRLLQVQEEERRRLARELHDDPLQNLTYLTRALDDLGQQGGVPEHLAAHLEHSGAVASEATSALRKIIHGLRPPVLDDLGLVSALRQLAHEARTRTSLAIDLRVVGEEVRLPADLELAVYRIAQESLNNTIRHADATHVSIRLVFGSAVVLTVTDDGHGIESAAGRPHRSGFGLIGMRERVKMAGGSLSVSTRRPHGTRVRATLPLTRGEDPPPSPHGLTRSAAASSIG